MLVGVLMVLAVYSAKPPLLFPPTSQGATGLDDPATRPTGLEPSIHPRPNTPAIHEPPKHKAAPKAVAVPVTQAPTTVHTDAPTQ